MKPLELHTVEGTIRSRHRNRGLGMTKRLPCPRDLAGRRRELWKRLSLMCADRTVSSDRETFRLLVDTLDEYIQLSETLRESGLTYKRIGTNGEPYYAIRPEVTVRRDTWTRLARLLSKFGLSPSDRVAIGISGLNENEDVIDKKRAKTWL